MYERAFLFMFILFIPTALYALWVHNKEKRANNRREYLRKNGLSINGKIIDFRRAEEIHTKNDIIQAIAEATFNGKKRKYISEKISPKKAKDLTIGQNVLIRIDQTDPGKYYFNPT